MTEMSSVVLDERTHEYTVHGKRFPGVTEIIQSAGLIDLSGISPDRLAAARQRGTDVHLACQYDDEGTLDESTLPENVAGYLKAYRRFKSECDFHLISAERPFYCPRHHYCGKPDLHCRLLGEESIVDIKSGIRQASTGVQLAAYRAGVGAPGAARYSLQLRPNGTYSLIPYMDATDWACFLSALTIYNWRKQHAIPC